MKSDVIIINELMNKKLTANELIQRLYEKDKKAGYFREDWRFYVHLNKRFNPLKRKGLLEECGFKEYPSKKAEKLWRVTPQGEKFLKDKDLKIN